MTNLVKYTSILYEIEACYVRVITIEYENFTQRSWLFDETMLLLNKVSVVVQRDFFARDATASSTGSITGNRRFTYLKYFDRTLIIPLPTYITIILLFIF